MRILVVDDSPGFLKAARFLLRQLGHEPVGLARSGEEGLAMAARLAPDAILMDINMPGMDGVETTRRLKSQPGSAPVIATSFQSDSAFDSRCAAAGCDAFIPKADLAEALPRVLAGLGVPGDNRPPGIGPTPEAMETRDV
jgi:CheY-like chemotaxis protein